MSVISQPGSDYPSGASIFTLWFLWWCLCFSIFIFLCTVLSTM